MKRYQTQEEAFKDDNPDGSLVKIKDCTYSIIKSPKSNRYRYQNFIVSNGGSVSVFDNSWAYVFKQGHADVHKNAFASVYSGGVASAYEGSQVFVFNEGQARIHRGGCADIINGGFADVYAGGKATVSQGGSVIAHPSSSVEVLSGGYVEALPGSNVVFK